MLDEALDTPRRTPSGTPPGLEPTALAQRQARSASTAAARRSNPTAAARRFTFSSLAALAPAGAFGDLTASRWGGWRLRLLLGSVLLGVLGVVWAAQMLVQSRQLDASWHAAANGRVELLASAEPELDTLRGQRLVRILADGTAGSTALEIDSLALHPSARWLVSDAQRARHGALHRALSARLQEASLALLFDNGESVVVPIRPRGVAGIAPVFWLLAALALGLTTVGVLVMLARPCGPNFIYLVVALCQAASLVFIGIELSFDLGTPAWFSGLDPLLRPGLDAASAAALVSALCLHPRRLPGATAIAATAWFAAAVFFGATASGWLSHAWWWTQAGVTAVGVVASVLLGWSYRLEPHPFAIVLRRFTFVSTSTWLMLSLAVVAAQGRPGIEHAVAVVGPLIWTVYFASLLMLVPFLSKSPRVMREFAMLAAIGTVAGVLHLVFVTVFTLAQVASLAVSLFVSLVVYAGARRWIVDQLMGSSKLTTERMFEQLYRIARAVEAQPDRIASLLSGLLRDIFEPIELTLLPGEATALTRVSGEGSTLLVPVPRLANVGEAGDTGEAAAATLSLRFAHGGRRLFTSDDARLTEHIVEQLQRAVAHDQAVEQGRSEERMRLAQDLHDDIGARLLTLMYKAQSPEMEEYLRHTLQDLKTLTRGLAASTHKLSDASAEWKSDLGQRLTAAHVELRWSCQFDQDIALNVVQWSALTRVLRELVSNVIAHSQAVRVEVDIGVAGGRLDLSVSDDGVGRDPAAWSHGLGLGGVRKRVKQLGGSVAWRELPPRGIACRVTVNGLAQHG